MKRLEFLFFNIYVIHMWMKIRNFKLAKNRKDIAGTLEINVFTKLSGPVPLKLLQETASSLLLLSAISSRSSTRVSYHFSLWIPPLLLDCSDTLFNSHPELFYLSFDDWFPTGCHSFFHSFHPQIFIQNFLCTRYYSRHWTDSCRGWGESPW